jgi:hypothetical protein
MFNLKGRHLAASGRRAFLKTAGVGALGVAGAGLLAKDAQAQRGAIDPLVLNFALNLEYLEADYYTLATQGRTIENATGPSAPVPINGQGTQGNVIAPANPMVPFANPDIASMAAETAADERAHAIFLRNVLTSLGVTPAARPQEDLLNSFAAAGAAIGVPGFNPFVNDLTFLLGAFIFEDVGVTAYKGAARLLTNKDILEAAAGILGVEAYHASWVRTLLFQQRNTVVGGLTVGEIVRRISDLRDSVDALDGSGTPGDDRDQGVTPDPVTGTWPTSRPPTPTVSPSPAPPRRCCASFTWAARPASGGGFFPAGLNGAIR